MSKYLRFYQWNKDNSYVKESAYEVFDTLEEAQEAVVKKGGFVVKTLDFKLIDEEQSHE